MKSTLTLMVFFILIACSKRHNQELKKEETSIVLRLPDGHYEDSNRFYNIDVVSAGDSSFVTIISQNNFRGERRDLNLNFSGVHNIENGTIEVSKNYIKGKVVYNNQDASMLQIVLSEPNISVTGH